MKFSLKSFCYIFADLLCLAASLFAAIFLRFDMTAGSTVEFISGTNFLFYVLFAAAVIFFGVLLGTYRTLYVSMSLHDVLRHLEITFLSVITVSVAHLVFDFFVSLSILLIAAFIFFLLALATRCAGHIYKLLICSRVNSHSDFRRVVVVGAGSAGSTLIHTLSLHPDMKLLPVAVVDDSPLKQKMSLSGVSVLGEISDVANIVSECRADEIIVAIPSASSAQFKTIYEKCKTAGVPVKTFGSLTDYHDFLSGSRDALKDLSIEDLLFRDSVKTDMSVVSEYIKGKTVLVTGGAGSIGSEICRQVLEYGCKYLVIMDINENGLFFLQNDLLEKYPQERFCVRIGSVRDKVRMDYLFRRHKFDMVLHAAAHKHVPLMEGNAFEAVKNNVFGTKNTIECCIENGVERFVLISTDKAVNPTNIMGATKRIAELLVQRYSGRGCELTAVRFGNVLGSNGSVIPVFRKQIEQGGPVTVTHRDIMRYFMTIPEAVSLVLTAGVTAKGGELFVLDMGEPVSIYDLACNMIELAGLRPHEDIEIEFTGLRPGEKMFEELKLDTESHTRTAHDKIFIMRSDETGEKLDSDIAKLESILASDSGEAALRDAVFETISIDFESSAKHGSNLSEFSALK